MAGSCQLLLLTAVTRQIASGRLVRTVTLSAASPGDRQSRQGRGSTTPVAGGGCSCCQRNGGFLLCGCEPLSLDLVGHFVGRGSQTQVTRFLCAVADAVVKTSPTTTSEGSPAIAAIQRSGCIARPDHFLLLSVHVHSSSVAIMPMHDFCILPVHASLLALGGIIAYNHKQSKVGSAAC